MYNHYLAHLFFTRDSCDKYKKETEWHITQMVSRMNHVNQGKIAIVGQSKRETKLRRMIGVISLLVFLVFLLVRRLQIVSWNHFRVIFYHDFTKRTSVERYSPVFLLSPDLLFLFFFLIALTAEVVAVGSSVLVSRPSVLG